MSNEELQNLKDLNGSYIGTLESIRNIVSNGHRNEAIEAINKVIDGYSKVMKELFNEDDHG